MAASKTSISSPDGRWTVRGPVLPPRSLLIKRILANVPRAIISSLPRREPTSKFVPFFGQKTSRGTGSGDRSRRAYMIRRYRIAKVQYTIGVINIFHDRQFHGLKLKRKRRQAAATPNN
uniref:Uncharacterized protein n=1 Tax=Romanomermis culicivorax TaxID=13658 RepID=A0A915J4H8_ROMCU